MERKASSYFDTHYLVFTSTRISDFIFISRWAVNCEGIQQIVRTIRNNNLDVEILCGSHWFQSTCSKSVHSCI